MKKGFTLIELLAVIVILAVIALISVPLILGVIEDSKVGAFKDSVSLTFSSAELYEAQNTIPESGIEIKNLNIKNNNFKYGKIVKNENNELVAVNVSDGRYCAFGLLTNITIYKGECDTVNPLAPTVSVEDSIYATTKEYTLSTPSTMSGIDSYEYYLSDTTDIPSSDVVISGSSKINKIIVNKVSKYVFFRVVSKANLKGEWSSAKTNYVDLTDPTASLSTNTITSKSVTLSATCLDNESGITKYEFSKDNGTTYVDNGTGSAYTFNDLTSGNYTFKVKCTSGALVETVASVNASPAVIDAPTYSISPTGYVTSKTLTINYPSGYTNEYSLDGGTSWNTYTVPLTVTNNITVIARVNDGLNYIAGSSYTVSKILFNDDYRIWLDLAGVDYTSYASIDDVLANSTQLSTVMSNQDSVNYMMTFNDTLRNKLLSSTNAMGYLINSSMSLNALGSNTTWKTALKSNVNYVSVYVPLILDTASLTNLVKYNLDLPCYFYNLGNEQTALTGNWAYTASIYAIPSYGHTATYARNSDNLFIHLTGQNTYTYPAITFKVTNDIDYTNYTKLVFNVTAINGFNALVGYTNTADVTSTLSNLTATNVTMDISAVTNKANHPFISVVGRWESNTTSYIYLYKSYMY